MQQVSYTSSVETRKGTRIWIEGETLNRSGFVPGTPISITYDFDNHEILITPDENSTRIVTNGSRNGKARPIIDMQNKKVDELFPVGTRVVVMYQQGLIQIRANNEVQAKDEREQRLATNLKAKSLTTATMFSGGGISHEAIHTALSDQGIKANTAWLAEAEVKYSESSLGNCLSITDDTTLLSGTVEEIEDIYYRKVDILTFSMPCAGFSKAGKVKHKMTSEQHSGTALFGVYNALKHANPAIVISENVTEAQDSPMYTLLRTELERRGYKIFEQTLNAKHTDSIENRNRYWLVAISQGLAPTSLALDHVPASGVSLDSILQSVPEDEWKDHTYLKDKAIKDAAAGKGFAKRQLLDGTETRIGTIGRFYAKRRSTEPFMTRSDGKERLLTPIEHAAVKSIPPRLIKGVSTTTAHEILGQSVDFRQPYELMKLILKRVVKSDTSINQEYPYANAS